MAAWIRARGVFVLALTVLAGRVTVAVSLEDETCPDSVKCGGFLLSTQGTEGDPLQHTDGQPSLALRYNYVQEGRPVDVVVHYHGYSHKTGEELMKAALAISGLQLGKRRGARPTLGLLPRGSRSSGGRADKYVFSKLVKAEAFDKLIAYGLKQLTKKLNFKEELKASRIILTGHSGGGTAVYQTVANKGTAIKEAYIYDGTYGSGGQRKFKKWLEESIDRDLKEVEKRGTAGEKAEYMSSEGGACRVFYLKNSATQPQAKRLDSTMDTAKALKAFYRVSAVSGGGITHNNMPGIYGPLMLADPNNAPRFEETPFPAAASKTDGSGLFCYDSKASKFEQCNHGLQGTCCAKHNNCCAAGHVCATDSDKCVKREGAEGAEGAEGSEKDDKEYEAKAAAAAQGLHSRYQNVNTKSESKTDTSTQKEQAKPEPSTSSTCRFQTPCDGVYTSAFKERNGRWHWGIDIAKTGTIPIYATAAGKVAKVETNCKDGDKKCGGSAGNQVRIEHKDGWTSQYFHLKHGTLKVKAGEQVTQGQELAAMGNTGHSTGQHLHFELSKGSWWPRTKEAYIDPCTGKTRSGTDTGHKIKCPAVDSSFSAKQCP